MTNINNYEDQILQDCRKQLVGALAEKELYIPDNIKVYAEGHTLTVVPSGNQKIDLSTQCEYLKGILKFKFLYNHIAKNKIVLDCKAYIIHQTKKEDIDKKPTSKEIVNIISKKTSKSDKELKELYAKWGLIWNKKKEMPNASTQTTSNELAKATEEIELSLVVSKKTEIIEIVETQTKPVVEKVVVLDKTKREPKYMGSGMYVHEQFNPKELVEGDTYFDCDFGDVIWNGKKWVPNTNVDYEYPVEKDVGVTIEPKKDAPTKPDTKPTLLSKKIRKPPVKKVIEKVRQIKKIPDMSNFISIKMNREAEKTTLEKRELLKGLQVRKVKNERHMMAIGRDKKPFLQKEQKEPVPLLEPTFPDPSYWFIVEVRDAIKGLMPEKVFFQKMLVSKHALQDNVVEIKIYTSYSLQNLLIRLEEKGYFFAVMGQRVIVSKEKSKIDLIPKHLRKNI